MGTAIHIGTQNFHMTEEDRKARGLAKARKQFDNLVKIRLDEMYGEQLHSEFPDMNPELFELLSNTTADISPNAHYVDTFKKLYEFSKVDFEKF